MLKISNKRFKTILIPILVILFLLCLITTISMNSQSMRMDTYWGKGERRVLRPEGTKDWNAKYYDGYNDWEATKASSYEVAEKVSDEGVILLKNNGVLPLARGSKVAPFGRGYLAPVYGQNGSGSAKNTVDPVKPSDSLSEYFAVNNAAADRMSALGRPAAISEAPGTIPARSGSFGGDSRIYEYDTSVYGGIESAVSDSVGIVFITRSGQENSDKKYDGYTDGTPHYLALTVNEKNTVKFVKNNCAKVVVVFIASAAMELMPIMGGESEADAILWVGHPGGKGLNSLGRVLTGEVNPSGRTVDIFPADFTKDPSYQNFGEFYYTNTVYRDHLLSTPKSFAGKDTDGRDTFYRCFIEYQEDIYIGYRYYETAASIDTNFTYGELDGKGAIKTPGAVAYPFGYGLSYTEFKQSIVSYSDSGENITMTVKVENTGSKAGKEVVQVYYDPPYTPASASMKIEKAAANLIAFAKTDNIRPGDHEEIRLSFLKEDMASYCYTRGNPDGTTGCYVLEQGDYAISLNHNSHDIIGERVWRNNKTVWYDGENPRKSERDAQSAMDGEGNILNYPARAAVDPASKYKAATNLFQPGSDYMNKESKVLSRSDWSNTFPAACAGRKKEIGAEFKSLLGIEESFDVAADKELGNIEGSKIYKDTMPVSDQNNGLTLADMRGKDYYDENWQLLLDQINWEGEKKSITELLCSAAYQTQSVNSVGLPFARQHDGINGIKADGNASSLKTAAHGYGPLMAATWNVSLMEELGKAFAREAMAVGQSGWYSPAINLHRSPFAGRTFEYYSEDPVLSGKLAAAVISGAGSQGMYCHVKHFALNDQETNRPFVLHTWATEQAMRELYFKAFEIAFKEARMTIKYTSDEKGTISTKTMRAATAVMAAQVNIGPTVAHGNYQLLTGLLRDEWNFCGTVITDMSPWISPDPDRIRDLVFRAGGDLYLLGSSNSGMKDYDSPTARNVMRRALHNIAYTIVNSMMMQDAPPGSIIYYDISPWKIWLIAADAVTYTIISGMIAWIVLRHLDEKKHPDKYRETEKI